MDAVVFVATAVVEIRNVARSIPAGTTRELGTVAALFVLASATVIPPNPAASDSSTVPPVSTPPMTALVSSTTELSGCMITTVFARVIPPSPLG
jgi:hypothetical protein